MQQKDTFESCLNHFLLTISNYSG